MPAIPAMIVRALGALVLLAAAGGLWGQTVHREVMPSGLTVVIQEFHSTAAVEVRVNVRASPLSEGPLLGSGASVLLQRLLVNSDQAGQSADEVKRAIARLGNQFQSSTSVASSSYCLSTTGDKVADALALLAGLVSNYAYNQVDLQRERQALIATPPAGLAALSDILLNSVVYRQHPARLPVTGMPRMMDQLTVDLMKRYQAARYTSANTVVTVVGNVNTNDVRKWIEHAFSRYSVGGYQPANPVHEPAQFAPRYASAQADVTIPRVIMAWRTETIEHAVQPALAALAEVLGDGRRGALRRTLDALPAAPGFPPASLQVENHTAIEQPGYFAIGFDANAEQRVAAEQAVRSCLETLAKDGPSPEELDVAKRRLRLALAQRQAQARTLCEDLATWELAAGDPTFGRKYTESIDLLIPQDVANAARRYLVADGINRTCTVALRPTAEAPLANGTVGAPTGTLKPEVVQLAKGGLRLLLRPTQELPLAHVRLTIGGGSAAEDAAFAGASAVLADLMSRATENRTPTQIDALLEAKGMRLDVSSDRHALSLGITCFPEDVEQALELLVDFMTRPALAKDVLEQVRGRAMRRREAADISWEQRLLADLRGVLFAGHYAARDPLGSKESLAALDRAVLADLHQRLAVSGNTALSVYGHFDRTAVLPIIERLLSTRPMGKDGTYAGPPAPAPAGPLPPISVGYHKLSTVGVALAWPGPGLAQRGRDEAPLAVLSAILSGVGAPGGRINRTLASSGNAAVVASGSELYVGRGMWAAWSQAEAGASEGVQQVIRDQVAGLVAQLSLPAGDPRALGDAELATAKAMCITSHALSAQDQEQVAARHAQALLLGESLDLESSYVQRIAAITVADLSRVAAVWLAGDPVTVLRKPRSADETGAVPAPPAGAVPAVPAVPAPSPLPAAAPPAGAAATAPPVVRP